MLIAWTVRALFESGLDSAPWQDEASNSTIAAGYFTDTITGLGSVQKDMNPTKLIGTNVGKSQKLPIISNHNFFLDHFNNALSY